MGMLAKIFGRKAEPYVDPEDRKRPVPRAAVIRLETKRGTCSWWPDRVQPSRLRTGFYIELTCGPYAVHVVEMMGGEYHLCGAGGRAFPPIPEGRMIAYTLGEAEKIFTEAVNAAIREFVRIEMIDPNKER